MARCLRVGKGTRFRVELKELEIERTANRADDVNSITSEIFGQFEAWIREHPSSGGTRAGNPKPK
jgi:KDO2-lipid IV(A) lauroyltransferase